MIQWEAIIEKFDARGEKTGWRYVRIPADVAGQLNAGVRKSFRVSGSIDGLKLEKAALIPMGDGDFILPVNAGMRKALRKQAGARVALKLSHDAGKLPLHGDFVACLADDDTARNFFQSLPVGHQQYFNKWISSAKTQATRDKRIAQALQSLAAGRGFAEMVHFEKRRKI